MQHVVEKKDCAFMTLILVRGEIWSSDGPRFAKSSHQRKMKAAAASARHKLNVTHLGEKTKELGSESP